jgi:mRNA-degrading endonuclease toxin of MazEF toxin-antitoxin module
VVTAAERGQPIDGLLNRAARSVEGWVNRTDVVTVAVQGVYGKHRPAVVVQSGLLNETHPSITLLPLISTLMSSSESPARW